MQGCNDKRECLAESSHPFLVALWTIFTFVYSYPRKRSDENYAVFILQTVIVFAVRFPCVIGAVWFLVNWIRYIKKRSSRPFNVLQHESEQGNLTTPTLRIYSTEIGKLNVTGMYFSNRTITTSHPVDVRYKQNDTHLGDELAIVRPPYPKMNGRTLSFLQIEIQHYAPLLSYNWTRINLVHPASLHPDATSKTSRGRFNRYYFLPGHFVEIRFTPLQFNSVYKPNKNTSKLERFMSFFELMDGVRDFSYQSTIQHIPFPQGWYNNMTTVIILRPQSTIEMITYQEETTSFSDTVAKIGGLIGFVSSVLIFLFGSPLLSPFGFIGDIPFFQRRIGNSITKEYDSPDTTPFAIKNKENEESDSQHSLTWRMSKLQQRIINLELVLGKYYLETSVFQHHSKPPKVSNPPSEMENTSSSTGTSSVLEQGQDQTQQESVQRCSSTSVSHAIRRHRGGPTLWSSSEASGADGDYNSLLTHENVEMPEISTMLREQ